MKFVRIAAVVIAALAASPLSAAEGPKWSGWGDDLFTRAAAEKRFVILDLEAVWCHWCHVPTPICRTATANAATGKCMAGNACKGTGFSMMSEAQCKAKGGAYIKG
jgi:hypothetical protein